MPSKLIQGGVYGGSSGLTQNQIPKISTVSGQDLSDSGIADDGTTVSITERVTTTDGVTSGTARVVGGRAYTNTAASSAVTNTTTETLFDQNYSVPANTLKAGSLIKIFFQGIATATNATDTLAVKLYIGGLTGTAILTLAARDVANNDIFAGLATVVVRTAGAAGTFVATGFSPANPNAAGTAVNQNFTASTTIDTTAAQVIGASATWSVANVGNSCRLDILAVEIY